MPPNCPWTAPSRATIVSRGGRTPGGAERPASVRVAYEFFADWDLSTNDVRRWTDGREFEQADQCKRIFGKGLGEPRAVSSADTTVRCASRGFSRDFCHQSVRGWRVKSGPDASNGRSRREAAVVNRGPERLDWARKRTYSEGAESALGRAVPRILIPCQNVGGAGGCETVPPSLSAVLKGLPRFHKLQASLRRDRDHRRYRRPVLFPAWR